MPTLENQLGKVREEERKILEKIDARNKRKEIKCEGCSDYHKIGELTAIQTHWYISPTGCTEGDEWREGELQFRCPETNILNRLLFDNYDVPYGERDEYKNNPEEQFKRKYKELFREVKDTYDKEKPEKFVNNYYVDKNRKKFGLVEKRKENKR